MKLTNLVPLAWGDKAAFKPNVDMIDNDDHFKVLAELPGLDENDIDLSITAQALTIKGQKTETTEHKGKDYYWMERAFGNFSRRLPLPDEVDPEQVEATFKKGILTVILPKTPEAQRRTKIAVKAEQ